MEGDCFPTIYYVDLIITVNLLIVNPPKYGHNVIDLSSKDTFNVTRMICFPLAIHFEPLK